MESLWSKNGKILSAAAAAAAAPMGQKVYFVILLTENEPKNIG